MARADLTRCYELLGELARRGDDAFLREGPSVLKRYVAAAFPGDVAGFAPAGDCYTRRPARVRPGEHAIYHMEWPPGFVLMPHEHHGQPCFEVLVEGELVVCTWRAGPLPDGDVKLSLLETRVVQAGESAVVDPRVSEVHSVFAPVRTRSVHVYPEDHATAFGYLPRPGDAYRRTQFTLRRD